MNFNNSIYETNKKKGTVLKNRNQHNNILTSIYDKNKPSNLLLKMQPINTNKHITTKKHITANKPTSNNQLTNTHSYKNDMEDICLINGMNHQNTNSDPNISSDIYSRMNAIYAKFNFLEKSKTCHQLINGKTIVNIYQPRYQHNKSIKYASGFGDFLRGCYFLLQFTSNINTDTAFCINHHLTKYLRNNTKHYQNKMLNCLPCNDITNWSKCVYDRNNNIISNSYKLSDIDAFLSLLINYARNTKDKNIYIYVNMYPMINIPNYHKELIINMLEPSDEINDCLQTIMNKLQLTKNNYRIIHIRMGDKYIKNISLYSDKNKSHTTLISKIRNVVNNNKDDKYLLISDCNTIKPVLMNEFNNIIGFQHEIAHFGEGQENNELTSKNNMIDFYLMSFSRSINSFTCYPHGTGFSLWCALTYDVPYNCMYIP
tara:strand:+ start:541 stop:1827 length:1287 start_codon:yes stop_codon:yes gene_type:complete